LTRLATEILTSMGISDSSILQTSRLDTLASTAFADFAPSCAIIGGILGQDILSALGRTEAPILNFLVFDGESAAADIYQLNVTPTTT